MPAMKSSPANARGGGEVVRAGKESVQPELNRCCVGGWRNNVKWSDLESNQLPWQRRSILTGDLQEITPNLDWWIDPMPAAVGAFGFNQFFPVRLSKDNMLFRSLATGSSHPGESTL